MKRLAFFALLALATPAGAQARADSLVRVVYGQTVQGNMDSVRVILTSTKGDTVIRKYGPAPIKDSVTFAPRGYLPGDSIQVTGAWAGKANGAWQPVTASKTSPWVKRPATPAPPPPPPPPPPPVGTVLPDTFRVGIPDTAVAVVTPPPPPPGAGAFLQNKPANLATRLLDETWASYADASGRTWTELFEVPAGAITVGVSDPTSPRGDGKVLEFKYLNPSYTGSGAGSVNVDYPAQGEVYVSFLWYASASPSFTWAHYSNKLLYVGNPGGSGGNWIIEMACHEGDSYNGNFFILHNNGSDGGYGVADGNFGYPWGYGEGSGNPTHGGTLPQYRVQRGHWYEVEFYAKKGPGAGRAGNITYLWARDLTAGEARSTQLVTMDDAHGTSVDQSGHTWSHMQLQSILGGGSVNTSGTIGQFYHEDQFTAYGP